jgi:hypothetical protein
MCGEARIDARETTPVARVLNSLARARESEGEYEYHEYNILRDNNAEK